MLRVALAVVLCLAGAGSAAAESSMLSPQRLQRLMAERGTIRRQLEVAFPAPGVAPATLVLEAQVGGSLFEPAPAAASSPPTKRRIDWGLVFLGVLVAYVTLSLLALRGFDP